jgi:hypothetical protein
MSDQPMSPDPDHPWVTASMMGHPAPVPTNLALEPVQIEQGGVDTDAVMLTIVDPTGIKNVFMPPEMLAQVVQSGMNILAMFDQRKQQGLVIASPSDMKNVVAQKKQFDGLKSV